MRLACRDVERKWVKQLFWNLEHADGGDVQGHRDRNWNIESDAQAGAMATALPNGRVAVNGANGAGAEVEWKLSEDAPGMLSDRCPFFSRHRRRRGPPRGAGSWDGVRGNW